MAVTSEQQRLAAEKKNIKVESYQDVAFEGAWKGRVRGLWAVPVLGLGFGAAVGAIAPFFPVVGGASLAYAASMVPTSVAIFSALGMGTGFAAGMSVGIASGAVASVAKEQERREKVKEINQNVKSSPEAVDVPKIPPSPAKNLREKLKDIADTYFNPKVGAVFAAVGAISGLVLAAAIIMTGESSAVPAMGVMLGEAAKSAPAIAAYCAGVMGSFGALFAFNFPKMATDLAHFAGDMLSGEAIGAQHAPKLEQPSPVPLAQPYAAEKPEPARGSFSNGEKRFALQALLDKPQECGCGHER